MAMMISGTNNASDYSSRTVTIEVTGLRRQDIMKTSNYTIKVPYSQMSSAIQSIMRMEGKVSNVTLGSESESQSN